MFRNLKLKKIKPVFYLSICFLISVVWFGLPMAKKINVNPDYNSIVNIGQYLKEYDAPVFEFQAFAPEIIWEYGKPIPVLAPNDKLKKPSLDKFLLLSDARYADSLQNSFNKYKIKKIDSIDMNPVGTKHKKRLYRDLYLLTK
jgi:hypothetical protein